MKDDIKRLFGSSRTGDLRGSGLSFIRRSCLFSRGVISHNRIRLAVSRLLRGRNLGGRFHLETDIFSSAIY